jgi:hypothetical protein
LAECSVALNERNSLARLVVWYETINGGARRGHYHLLRNMPVRRVLKVRKGAQHKV